MCCFIIYSHRYISSVPLSQFSKSETQDLKMKDICAKRGYDAWALQVAGLLESCTDLPSADAVYHKA